MYPAREITALKFNVFPDIQMWEQGPFLRELENGAVSLIILRIQPAALHETRYTPAMREILDRRYRIAFQYQLGAAFVALRPVEVQAVTPRAIAEDQ